jgi:hypothetical protein
MQKMVGAVPRLTQREGALNRLVRRYSGALELKGGLLRIWQLGPFCAELELKGGLVTGDIYALPSSSSALRPAVQ